LCDLCQGEQSVIYKDANKEWCIKVENSHWDDYNDCLDYTEVEIDFCPWCGRELDVSK
jgi:hypothetical protein